MSEDESQRDIRKLSGGQQQRIAIARAMATLCCSPPESSFGKLLYLSSKPNILSNSIDLFFKSIFLYRLFIYIGIVTFSYAFNLGF